MFKNFSFKFNNEQSLRSVLTDVKANEQYHWTATVQVPISDRPSRIPGTISSIPEILTLCRGYCINKYNVSTLF